MQQSGDANDRIFAAKTALKTKIVEQGRSYEVITDGDTNDNGTDLEVDDAKRVTLGLAVGNLDTAAADGTDGDKWAATASVTFATIEVVKQENQLVYTPSEGKADDILTAKIEAVQARVNTARVQAVRSMQRLKVL